MSRKHGGLQKCLQDRLDQNIPYMHVNVHEDEGLTAFN